MPRLSLAKAEAFLPDLVAGMAEFEINTQLRVSAYLAQLAQESTQLTRWEENLSYSAKRMTEVWPSRFPTIASAAPYAKNPNKLAIRVYGGRMGNRAGTEDGWDFRGRMPMQATGRGMYQTLSDILGVDLISDPDLCLDPAIAFRASAAIFAKIKGCNGLADGLIANPGNLKVITKRINGGHHGLAKRTAFYEKARRVLPEDLKIQRQEAITGELLEDILIPDSTAELSSDSQPTTDPAGSNSVELTGEEAGQPAPDPASTQAFTFKVEDWKGYIWKWLKRVWGYGTGANFAQATTFLSASASDPDRAPYYIGAGVLTFFLIASLVILATIGLLVWLFINRKEVGSYWTQYLHAQVTPGVQPIKLEFEKK